MKARPFPAEHGTSEGASRSKTIQRDGVLIMRLCLLSGALAVVMLWPSLGFATESDFLKSFEGNWNGRGMVLTRIGANPINVRCNLTFAAGSSSLSMQGNCRGLLVVRRSISADLRVSGQQRYSGTYVGPGGLASSLWGRRQGNAINLAVRWAKSVNGDRAANMTIEKIGNNRVRLQTIDRDPETGSSVVTSRIDVSR